MKKIARYIVRGLLGRGGMAKVYKVEIPTIGKIAALKLFDPDPLVIQLIGADALHALFVNEAVIMARLEHPNIVAIHDFDQDCDRPFYVMDFFANNLGIMMGESYHVEKPSRTLSPDKALDYTRQTLEGLACLHDAGIVHRDIKPYNLLVTAQDVIKICDFGLSKLRAEIFSGPKNLNVGSPYYAAPEQETNPDDSDERADLFPVGVMLYRMLTGRLPASDDQRRNYQPCRQWNSDLDEAWDNLIKRAIANNPNRRFATAGAMLAAVDELAGHWQFHKDKSCALFADTPTATTRTGLKRLKLRSKPLKVRPKDAAANFKLDSLWRPQNYVANHYETRLDGTIADYATGLIWQQAGSSYPNSRQQAMAYIESLNDRQFANRTDWRLPTIEELIILLRPAPNATDLCIESIFDKRQRWIWSIDRRSFTAAYYVDMELGFIGWQDFSAPYYARGVCSRKS